MAAKTYPRFALRVLRPRDQTLGGTSDYYPIEDPDGIIAGGLLATAGSGTVLAAVTNGGQEALVAVALQAAVDKDGNQLVPGDEIETFLANNPYRTWLEGNLLTGGPGAQGDHVLVQDNLFSQVTLRYDLNYLGFGQGGYYFDVTGSGGGIGGVEGQGTIVSFTNTRVPSDNEESYSVPGDTNAVVRVQMLPNEWFLGTQSVVLGP